MSRILKRSRKFALGLAFVSVMGGAGALGGAILGVMLVLLSHVVLGMNAGMTELMPASMGLGGLLATSFGVFLAVPSTIRFNWQPGLVALPNPESEADIAA